MPASALPVLAALVRTLSRRDTVDRVVLFGSRARGDSVQRSDIDLAVEAGTADEREWDWITETVDNADTFVVD